MTMPGFDAIGRPSIGQISNPATTQSPFGWFTPLSEPVRQKVGLVPRLQQAFAFGSQFPVVSFSWFETLSEPVRIKPGLRPGAQQFIAWQPAPSPFVATGWFEPLSEPVRPRPRSPAALSPFQSWQPAPSPFVATGWYSPFSEPVRFKQGLAAARQQFLAAPAQLRPNPKLSGTMNALETKDVMLAAGQEFNRIISGEVGVIEKSFTGGEVGIAKQTITSAKVSIRIN